MRPSEWEEGRRASPAGSFARRLVALADFLAGMRGGRFGGRAPAFLHAGGVGALAARRFVLARDRLIRVIAQRHHDREHDQHGERAQAALRTLHHPALRRPASPPRSPSRIASARAMEKSRGLRSKPFTLSGIMKPWSTPRKMASPTFFIRAAAPR